MAQLVSVWSNVVRACGQGNDVAPVQQESEQRAVALLSRNTVLEEELASLRARLHAANTHQQQLFSK